MTRKPRTWNQIIQQQGVGGILIGEDIRVEEEYKAKLFRRKR